MAREELKGLSDILKKSEQTMGLLEGGKATTEQVLPKVCGFLQTFRAQAQAMGLKGLVQAGQKIEQFAQRKNLSAEDLTTLTFAFGFLRGGVDDGSSEGIRSAIIETLELLGIEPMDVSVPHDPDEKAAPKKKKEESWMVEEHISKPAEQDALLEDIMAQLTEEPPPVEAPPPPKPAVPPKPAPKATLEVELDRKATPKDVAESSGDTGPVNLDRIASRLGGKLVEATEDGAEAFRLEFPASSLDKVKFLLSPFDPDSALAEQIPAAAEDEHLRKVIDRVKDFMASFAEGDLSRAQEVLEELSGIPGENELFKEIGGLARELHDLLKGFADMLSPGLSELVEDKIPDTGNRLEHIMKLTEEAANTTLDHAETIQQRIKADEEKLERLQRHLSMLMPIGDAAYDRMDESVILINDLKASLAKNQNDINTIQTSQGYQDLTGQVISKVVSFQKDLEGRLVNLVRSFGVRVTRRTQKAEDELYGPAHDKKEGAVRGQDEVDAILAQFGF